MNLSDIKLTPNYRRRRKIVGRGTGSQSGKTSGRGQKGAGSRSGYKAKRFYEGGQMPLFRRIPKRGFTNALFKQEYGIINVGELNEFASGSVVSLKDLQAKGLLKDPKAGLKVLGDGELKVALTVEAKQFSKSAREKIEKAGGQVKEI
jgi:large subunit ribosomal protein L15